MIWQSQIYIFGRFHLFLQTNLFNTLSFSKKLALLQFLNCNFLNKFSMIYKAAPAWTFKGKDKHPAPAQSPSPLTYSPQIVSALTKSPSWKMGKEIRQKNKQVKSPSPASYHLSEVEKSKTMGIIGHSPRGKENRQSSPGPGSYHVQPRSSSKPSISFAKKYQFINKTLGFPGPGNYEIPDKKEKRGIKIGREMRFTAQNQEKVDQPGPGNYNWTRPNSASIRFNKAPRMSHEHISTIGPGQYDLKRQMDTTTKGFTMSSKYKTSTGDLTPGPMNYSPTHYDLPSSPSITLSKKYKPKQPERSPSPNQYHPQYEQISSKAESYSLSKAQRLPLNADTKGPGPGAYLSTEYTNTGAEISLGMSRRYEQKSDFPGPGAYDPKKQVIQKRPQTAKIGKSRRFYTIKTETSPSFYESKIELTSPKYSFSKKKKLNDYASTSPGPGAYNIPSSLCNLSAYASRQH